MKREVRDRRNELRETGKKLRDMTWELDYSDERLVEIREKQDEEYKKFKFYDGMIKANEKLRRDK